jgi:hypothetical protein
MVVDKARPTRWQKARTDWSGIRAKREVLVGLVGGIATAGVQVLVGSPGAVDTLITAGVGALVTVVVFPLGELGLRWLQAPMRLLTDDVVAIRSRLDSLDIGAAQPRPRAAALSPRLAAINHKRVGDELVGDAARYKLEIGEANAQRWTNAVIDFLSEHSSPGSVELFMTAGSGSNSERMDARLQFLANLIERWPAETG